MNSMTSRKSLCAVSLALALGSAVPALAKAPVQEKKNVSTATSEVSSSTRTIVGTLSDLKAGHSLSVMKVDRSVETYDLEDKEFTYNLEPEVKKGSAVVVTETVQADGKHVVSVAAKK